MLHLKRYAFRVFVYWVGVHTSASQGPCHSVTAQRNPCILHCCCCCYRHANRCVTTDARCLPPAPPTSLYTPPSALSGDVQFLSFRAVHGLHSSPSFHAPSGRAGALRRSPLTKVYPLLYHTNVCAKRVIRTMSLLAKVAINS